VLAAAAGRHLPAGEQHRRVHLITGAPGLGTNGTAGGDCRARRREFLPINPGAPNPYERRRNNVLACPVVHQTGS
jgi:hypothetical protein